MEKPKWNKERYEERKAIPTCPRCNSNDLEFKKTRDGLFTWCAECRRKNRKYKGLGEFKEREEHVPCQKVISIHA